MPAPPIDVLIIGAGPVGLAAALGASYRGARRIVVVEKAGELRQAGANLNLLPNAFRALCSLAPSMRERFKPYIAAPKPGRARRETLSAKGRVIEQTFVSQEYALLLWWQLQKLLLEALPEMGIVILDHQLLDISYDEAGIVRGDFIVGRERDTGSTKHVKNWVANEDVAPVYGKEFGLHTGAGRDGDDWYWDIFERCEGADLKQFGPKAEKVRCRAKMILGADGINSVARRCIYRDSGDGWEEFAGALYSGFSRVAMRGIPKLKTKDEDVLTELYVKNCDFVSLIVEEEDETFESPRLMILNSKKDNEPRSWFLIMQFCMDEDIIMNATGEHILQVTCEMLREAGHSEELVELCKRTFENSGKFMNRSFYVVPASHPPPYEMSRHGGVLDYPPDFERPWYHRRVVLAGDAIHAMPPTQAQGSAMGFEDVLELVTRLEDAGVWSELGEDLPSEETLGKVFEGFRAARFERICEVQKGTLNRTSDHEVEKGLEDRNRIWSYEPLGTGRFS